MNSKTEKTMKALEANNMKAYYIEKKEDVVPLIKDLIKDGETVSNGGSMTLFDTGVMDLLKSGTYDYIDRSKASTNEEKREAYLKAFACDTYFCSTNAVTENGELYNVDGNANRIAAISYGPRSVIMVVGENKIVKNLKEAEKRVKTVAAPKNTVRLNCETYCKETGHCLSLDNNDCEMTNGCRSDSRICCSYLICAKQRIKNRIKVIFVGEALGY